MTARANLYIDQGVDFLVSLDLETDDGEDFPVSTQQFFCQVRKVYSTTVQFEANLTAVVNGTTNTVTLSFNPEDTANVKEGKYQYDLLMVESGGKITKILEGLLFVLPTITRLGEPTP
jgi:hypothetical protein